MRKALIAAAVATALFAVGAFAASFTVSSEDIASGTNPVDSCADSATVDFTEKFVAESQNWVITAAVVTLDGGSDCVTADVQLILQDDDNSESFNETLEDIADADPEVEIAAPDAVLTFPVADLPVAEVDSASVLVDSLQLSTT